MRPVATNGRPPEMPSGFELVTLDEIDSTNEEARRRAQAGADDGLLIWARSQNLGRGRRGRRWVSPPGNLYSSLLLRPDCSAGEAATLSYVAALAVADTAAMLLPSGADIRCKWPNDVLVAGQKVAGILLESHGGGDGGLDWLIIGVGINVAHYPDVARLSATSLADKGATATVDQVLQVYAAAIARWLAVWRAERFAPVRAAWLERAHGLGEAIRVRLAERTFDGIFEGLDDDGALILAQPTGARRRVTAGEVFDPASPS